MDFKVLFTVHLWTLQLFVRGQAFCFLAETDVLADN